MSAHFGAKLRRLRESCGLTQTELSAYLGLTSQSHIAKLEATQDRPSLDVVTRAAALFSASVDDLLRDTTPTESLLAGHLGVAQMVSVDAARLGAQVRTLRQARGWTQAALAQRLGPAGQSGIGKIERGEKLPSLERLVLLADTFGIALDALIHPALQTIDDRSAGE